MSARIAWISRSPVKGLALMQVGECELTEAGIAGDREFFLVDENDRLVNIGKAYTGLTDAEIATLTEFFLKTQISRHGPVLIVEPKLVLEIAFDRIQESSRHKSGYAMRFPRIVRIRDDKTVDEISTIDEMRRIYEGQLKRENQS